MRRLAVILVLLALPLLGGRLPAVGAQIPLPPVDEPVDEVVHEVVDEVVKGVDKAVKETVHTAEAVVPTGEVAEPPAAPAAGGASVSPGGGGTGLSVEQPGGSASGDRTPVADGSGARDDPGGGDAASPGGSGGRGQKGSGGPPPPRPAAPGIPEELFTLAAAPVKVVKTNDADGDGSYSDAETTPVPESEVPFAMTVVNQSLDTVTIIQTSDFFPGPTGVSDQEVCRGLVGRTLASGQSVTCRFTLPGYAPAVGASKVNTLSLQLMASGGDPSAQRTLFATDASTVRTSETDVLGLVVQNPGTGLAGTGAAVWMWGAVALALGAVGIGLLRLGRDRRSARGPSSSTP